MRNVKMSEVVSRAIGRTSTILFSPFSLKKWLILIFIALFAGSLSLGNSHGSSSHSSKASKSVSTATVSQAAQPGGAGAPAETLRNTLGAIVKAFQSKTVLTIAITIVLLITAFIVISIWVGCRFKFIWFNAIATNDASIIEPFHRHRAQASSLFRAMIVISLIFLSFTAAIIGWGIAAALKAGAFQQGFAWSVPVALKLFVGPICAFIVLFLIWMIFYIAINNFGVMVMAMDKIGFVPGMKKVLAIYRKNMGDIILYHLMLLLLSVACFLAMFVILIIIVLLSVLIGLVVFGGGYLLFKSIPLLFVIYLIVLGIPALILFIMIMFCAVLPFSIFQRSFSIEYLLSLDCGYTPERIIEYAKVRSPERSRSAIIIPILLISVFVAVFVIGLLAAIAIPNFIKAREKAQQKAAQSGGKFSAAYRLR